MRRLVWSAVVSVALFVAALVAVLVGVLTDYDADQFFQSAQILAIGSLTFAVLSLRER